MDLLKKRILQDGKCFEGGILKVDSFINHQMDPLLMKSIGVEFVRSFANKDFNKVMTIEARDVYKRQALSVIVGQLSPTDNGDTIVILSGDPEAMDKALAGNPKVKTARKRCV